MSSLEIDTSDTQEWAPGRPFPKTAAPEFATQQTKLVDTLEGEAFRRGVLTEQTPRKYKFHQGMPVMWYPPRDHPDFELTEKFDEETKRWRMVQVAKHYYECAVSDTLLVTLLKGNAPEKYQERADLNVAVVEKYYDFDPRTALSRPTAGDIQALSESGAGTKAEDRAASGVFEGSPGGDESGSEEAERTGEEALPA